MKCYEMAKFLQIAKHLVKYLGKCVLVLHTFKIFVSIMEKHEFCSLFFVAILDNTVCSGMYVRFV